MFYNTFRLCLNETGRGCPTFGSATPVRRQINSHSNLIVKRRSVVTEKCERSQRRERILRFDKTKTVAIRNKTAIFFYLSSFEQIVHFCLIRDCWRAKIESPLLSRLLEIYQKFGDNNRRVYTYVCVVASSSCWRLVARFISRRESERAAVSQIFSRTYTRRCIARSRLSIVRRS